MAKQDRMIFREAQPLTDKDLWYILPDDSCGAFDAKMPSLCPTDFNDDMMEDVE